MQTHHNNRFLWIIVPLLAVSFVMGLVTLMIIQHIESHGACQYLTHTTLSQLLQTPSAEQTQQCHQTLLKAAASLALTWVILATIAVRFSVRLCRQRGN